MPSPSAASENVVVYCAGFRGACTVTVPVRQTSNAPAAAWTRVSFSVFHTLQSSAAVHWSARTVVRQMRPHMQRVCSRPTVRPL